MGENAKRDTAVFSRFCRAAARPRKSSYPGNERLAGVSCNGSVKAPDARRGGITVPRGIPSAHMHWASISDLATLGMWADPGSYAWYVGGPR